MGATNKNPFLLKQNDRGFEFQNKMNNNARFPSGHSTSMRRRLTSEKEGHSSDAAQHTSRQLDNSASTAQIQKLLPSDGAKYANFGKSVAISGDVVVVGADDNGYYYGTIGAGSAYIFSATTRAELHKLVPFGKNGAGDDNFVFKNGVSVAVSGDVVVVGARTDDDKGNNSGSAYVFSATTGAELHKLVPLDGAADDWFGWSVRRCIW